MSFFKRNKDDDPYMYEADASEEERNGYYIEGEKGPRKDSWTQKMKRLFAIETERGPDSGDQNYYDDEIEDVELRSSGGILSNVFSSSKILFVTVVYLLIIVTGVFATTYQETDSVSQAQIVNIQLKEQRAQYYEFHEHYQFIKEVLTKIDAKNRELMAAENPNLLQESSAYSELVPIIRRMHNAAKTINSSATIKRQLADNGMYDSLGVYVQKLAEGLGFRQNLAHLNGMYEEKYLIVMTNFELLRQNMHEYARMVELDTQEFEEDRSLLEQLNQTREMFVRPQ